MNYEKKNKIIYGIFWYTNGLFGKFFIPGWIVSWCNDLLYLIGGLVGDPFGVVFVG